MRISKIIFLINLMGALFSFDVNAQSSLIREKFYLNQIIFNPAISGSEFDPALNVSAGKSWLGIEESPSNQMISTSLRMGNFDFYNPKMFLNKTDLRTFEKIGMGAAIYNKKEGPVHYRGAHLAYAYHVPFRDSRLSLGISGTYQSRMLDQTGFQPVNPADPGIDYSKEIIGSFNSNLGIYYYTPDYFAGISALNIFPSDKEYLQIKRAYSFLAGYIFKNIDNIMIEPSVFLEAEGSNLWYGIFTKALFRDLSWVAVGYQSDQYLSIKTGLKVRRFYLSYSLGFNTSRIVKYNAGTHEIGLGLNIGTRRLEGF